MQITISQKKTDYLTKKYGNAEAIIQQIVDTFINSEIERDYQKKAVLTTDDKLDALNKK